MSRGRDPKKQYGLPNCKWRLLREKIKSNRTTLEQLQYYSTEEIGKELSSEQLDHLYKRLLQNRYDIESGELLPRVGVMVYCDDLEYGRGTIKELYDTGLMLVKFDRRELLTMCSSDKLITVHDDIKRKLVLKD